MSNIEKEYLQWVEELSARYKQSQLCAAIRVNREMIRYYWDLGRDIEELHVESRWGESIIKSLSTDLRRRNPNSQGLSRTNIYYAKKFYLLYSQCGADNSRFLEGIDNEPLAKVADKGKAIIPQAVGQLEDMLFSIPWGHHRCIIDKCGTERDRALFYVRKTIEEGWSRAILLEFINSDLYGREGVAQTNFKRTLPDTASELAQELTKDPYSFAFTGITEKYNEYKLKEALLRNISRFLLELGTGFAYVGKEYRLQIGQKEKFIDLLFYNLNLSCYVVIEVKIGEFDFQDLGQLSGYVVACNHILRKERRDNPTIGLLICRQKDSLLAQYALEGSNLPLGISEYELSRLYPQAVDGTIPTIEEIESRLGENLNKGPDIGPK